VEVFAALSKDRIRDVPAVAVFFRILRIDHPFAANLISLHIFFAVLVTALSVS